MALSQECVEYINHGIIDWHLSSGQEVTVATRERYYARHGHDTSARVYHGRL